MTAPTLTVEQRLSILHQQVGALHKQVVDLTAQNLETRHAITKEVEAAFAAKWDAKFRELDDLRNEGARVVRKIIDAGFISQDEMNGGAHG